MKRGLENPKMTISKKNLGIFLLAIALVLVMGSFGSAQQVCCEKNNDGQWCQNMESQSDCDTSGSLSFAPTSCESTQFCQTGTCVDTNKGVCMPNTPKTRCQSEGGVWRPQDKDEIAMCQNGCCIAGEQTAYVTQTECKQIASDYGIDTNFRSDVNDENSCLALAQPDEKGACVTEEEVGVVAEEENESEGGGFFDFFGGDSESNESSTGPTKDCQLTTKEECQSAGGDFNPGMLCTAAGISDCAASGKTKCSEGDVYFVDTCGNLANVYDEDMYDDDETNWDQEMRDYWTYLKDVNDTAVEPTSEFGNCDYLSGTICGKYEKGDKGMPDNPPEYGENVCRDLGCYYDTNQNGTETSYDHGETWCAESEGTYPHVPSPTNITDKKEEEILNPSKYNVPGSRYYQLKCWEGEVIETACKDYRNEVCRETEINDFKVAQCVVNDWRECYSKDSRDSCEADEQDCKWIPGYRYDGQLVENETSFGDQPGKRVNENQQGSCVPLFAPGFDFWNSDSDAQRICDKASVTEEAVFETTWYKNRDKFHEKDNKDRIKNCVDGCYSIPEYGKKDDSSYYEPSKLKSFQTGGASISPSDYLSKREGYYCRQDPGGSNDYQRAKATPEVNLKNIKCAARAGGDDKDLAKRRSHIFYTHKQWLNSIRQRARLMGDCGYTPSIAGNATSPDTEVVNQMFQQLNQDGTPKDGDNSTTSETIYEGDDKVK